MRNFSLLMLEPLLVSDSKKIQQDKAVTHSVTVVTMVVQLQTV